MDIIVTDRESIETGIVVRTRYVVISIHDSGKRRPKVRKQQGLKDVLYLRFDDAEPSIHMKLPPTIKLMTAAHADSIWEFLNTHRKTIGTVVVHCEQGMSRSPAVAAAIARKFGVDEARFWRDYQPNRFVYDLTVGQLK